MFDATPCSVVKPHYIILGAGISGLATAWFLEQKYGNTIQLTVIEKEPFVGGHICTVENDGFLFEQGPRGCRTLGKGIDTLRLIEALGLEEEVIVASPAAKKKYRWRDQRLQQLPSSPFPLLFSPFFKEILTAIWRDWRAPEACCDDETIHAFVSRRCGEKIADLFFDPMVTGIYAGDIKKLSMKSCFPQLYEWERNHGSLWKGGRAAGKRLQERVEREESPFVKKIMPHGLFTLKSGMQRLPIALASRIKAELLLGTKVARLSVMEGERGVHLHLEGGKVLHADALFSTLSALQLAALMDENSIVVKELKSIHQTTVAVVNLGYRRRVNRQEGFGYLIPSKESEENLGVVWDSSVFPQQNHHPDETRLTVMLGGVHHPDIANCTHEELLDKALRSIRKQMGISASPDAVSVKVAHQAIPQYEVGYTEKIARIRQALSQKIILGGNWIEGLSVNDCIAHSKSHSGFGGLRA